VTGVAESGDERVPRATRWLFTGIATTELTCPQCCEHAAELALKELPDPVRARALAHVDHCITCRDDVSALTSTAAQLIELLPDVQPPAGFGQRVIDALADRGWRPQGPVEP
jgi:hypothetical protein